MKRHNLIGILSIIALSVTLFSCQKEYEAPEFSSPEYHGKAANHTIADIKAMHSISNRGQDSICAWNETFIVEAVVVSSDEGGNFYKSMVVQDATGGIELELDKNGLYNDYPVGQKVYIKCNGLVVGDYGGMHQVGWIYDGSVGRINSRFIDKYIFKSGVPSKKDIPTPLEITSSGDLTPENVCRLVTLKNVVFADEDKGLPFTTDDAVSNRTIATLNGEPVTNLVVRTSNYAKFRSMKVPTGACNLTGILTVFNSTYQLMIRVKDDIDALPEYEETLLKALTFNENSIGTDWKVYSTAGSIGWSFQKYAGNQFVYHQVSENSCDDWLVSPEINLDTKEELSFRIEHQNAIAGLQECYQCYYSTTYTEGEAIDASQWIAFDPNVNLFPASKFEASNIMKFKEGFKAQKFRIAIRYHNPGNMSTSRWMIRSANIYEIKEK